MKYYLSMIINYNDGTKDAPSIYTYTTESEASANFHRQMGNWMLKDNVQHIVAVVFADDGRIIKDETYNKPVEE